MHCLIHRYSQLYFAAIVVNEEGVLERHYEQSIPCRLSISIEYTKVVVW